MSEITYFFDGYNYNSSRTLAIPTRIQGWAYTPGTDTWTAQSYGYGTSCPLFELTAHDQVFIGYRPWAIDYSAYQAFHLYIRARNSQGSALVAFSGTPTAAPYDGATIGVTDWADWPDLSEGRLGFKFQLGVLSYAITAVDQGDKSFTITGDWRKQFSGGDELQITGSTGNNGTYTIDTVTIDGTDTVILVNESVPHATADGTILHSTLAQYISNGGQATLYMEIAGCNADGNWLTILPACALTVKMPLREEDMWDTDSGFVVYPTNSFYTSLYIDNNFYTKTATDTAIASGTYTFTNKTFNCTATGNSLTNIKNTNVASDAAIAASKINFSGAVADTQVVYGTSTGIAGESTFTYNSTSNTLSVSYLSTDIATLDSITFDTAASAPTYAEGKVWWNTTDKCLDVASGITNQVLQVGQEQVMKVINRTGSPILNGKAVYVTGSHSNRPTIALARADTYASSRVLGLVTADIADGAEGFVTMVGLVRDLNTNSYSEGTTLYLSAATAGEWTSSAPAAPNYTCRIGTVVRQQTTIGTIAVHVENGASLTDLSDVDGTVPVTGSLLVRLSTGIWDPTTTLLFNNTEKKITHTGKSGQTQSYLEINSFGVTTGDVMKVGSDGTLAVPTAKFGTVGGANYTEFLNDGTLVMNGTATVFDDLRIEPVARATGTNTPTFEKWYDNGAGSRGVFLYSFDDVVEASEKELHFTMQLPHDWANTAINIHVHWVGNVADTTAEPHWGLEYTWGNLGVVYGNSGIVYRTGNKITDGGTTDPDITANKHYISKFAAITPTSDQSKVSSVLIGRIFRNSSSASDTYDAATNKCGLLYIDAHYERNRLGTRTEYSN